MLGSYGLEQNWLVWSLWVKFQAYVAMDTHSFPVWHSAF